MKVKKHPRAKNVRKGDPFVDLKAIQRKLGLPPDGIMGPQTAQALGPERTAQIQQERWCMTLVQLDAILSKGSDFTCMQAERLVQDLLEGRDPDRWFQNKLVALWYDACDEAEGRPPRSSLQMHVPFVANPMPRRQGPMLYDGIHGDNILPGETRYIVSNPVVTNRIPDRFDCHTSPESQAGRRRPRIRDDGEHFAIHDIVIAGRGVLGGNPVAASMMSGLQLPHIPMFAGMTFSVHVENRDAVPHTFFGTMTSLPGEPPTSLDFDQGPRVGYR